MRKAILFCGIICIFFACEEKNKECNACDKELETSVEKKEKLQMYEPSELAVLMKTMYAQNLNWKAEVLKGNIPQNFPEEYRKMHTATSVNESAGTDFYNATATQYLESVEALSQATPQNVKEKYNQMVGMCVQCHQNICPGPIPKINKLLIE